jgi:hypothetical protein
MNSDAEKRKWFDGVDTDEQLNQEKQQFLLNRKLDYIKGTLIKFDLSDIITVLGESDLLECIGVKRCLDYVQLVGFGPPGEDRRTCRERVAELAYSFECDEQARGLAGMKPLGAGVLTLPLPPARRKK